MGLCQSSEPKPEEVSSRSQLSTKQNASPDQNSNASGSLGVGAASSSRSGGGLTLIGGEDHGRRSPSPQQRHGSKGGGGQSTALIELTSPLYSGGGGQRQGGGGRSRNSYGGWNDSQNQSFSSVPMGPRNDTHDVYEPSPMLFPARGKPMFPDTPTGNQTTTSATTAATLQQSVLLAVASEDHPKVVQWSSKRKQREQEERKKQRKSWRGEKEKNAKAGVMFVFGNVGAEGGEGNAITSSDESDGDCTSTTPSNDSTEPIAVPSSSSLLPSARNSQQGHQGGSESNFGASPVLGVSATTEKNQSNIGDLQRDDSHPLEKVKSWLATVNSETDFFHTDTASTVAGDGPSDFQQHPGMTSSSSNTFTFSGGVDVQNSTKSLLHVNSTGEHHLGTRSFGGLPGILDGRQISTISAELSPGYSVTVAVGSREARAEPPSGGGLGTEESPPFWDEEDDAQTVSDDGMDPWDPSNFTPGLSILPTSSMVFA